jgi:DNA-binding NtrC family response regulator
MRKILIVDDEPSILAGLSSALHKLCGFQGEIKTVSTGKDAIIEMYFSSYWVCFLDLELPDVGGLDVMDEIHEISPETNVAIISASSVGDEIRRTIEKKGGVFIPKPFDLSEIKAFLKHLT